ncbi:MAG: polyketide synthase dehydratase domain-containing protein [Spirochaetes bacterium]|nr:polyketide synthase dehydratase domain-containing protein [Spirochaetota bacterium]
MENLPEIAKPRRIPITIRISDYIRDHVFRERAVYPAVEAMRLLAGSTLEAFPRMSVTVMKDADFTRFIEIPGDASSIEAFHEINEGDGVVISKLGTLRRSGNTSITRAVEHVSIAFPGEIPLPDEPPLDKTLGLEGICATPERELIYGELVPFGPAYRNIESLHVSRDGVIAVVKGGMADAPGEPLGSPFPLDASFHGACVWGQRYAGIVGFPVHLDLRIIRKKTRAGETYFSRITPVSIDGDALVYNLWIYDSEGTLCEEVRGLRMRDVSGGTLLPPEWIRAEEGDPLGPIRSLCRDLCAIELGSHTAPCAGVLSEAERIRFADMREKRGRSFLGSRMALKTIARRMPGGDPCAAASALTTMHPDGRPRCPLPDGSEPFRSSASHDSRFVVAVIADHPVGIDVEQISGRVLKGRRLYMHEEELVLADAYPPGEIEASTRIWSIKEAVAKALGSGLPESWRRVIVSHIGGHSSRYTLDGETREAHHASVDGHLFTLCLLD